MGIVCVGASYFRIPSILNGAACRAIVAFREGLEGVSLRVSQMGSVLVSRPFVHMRLPMSDTDMLSPCAPGCR